jgi:hypothetical protein
MDWWQLINYENPDAYSKVYQNRIWWKTNPSPFQIGNTEVVTSQQYSLWSLQNPPQATAYSRMLLPHTGCVVVLSHVEKQHLVCLQVIQALITKPHMSWLTIPLNVWYIHRAK